MSLKLFRSTVWANSIGPNPPDPRHSGWNPLWLAFLASLWMASAGNLALWLLLYRLPDELGARAVFFSIGFGVMIACSLMALLSLLSWRWLLKPVIFVLLLAAAAGTHFMLVYGTVIDPTMIVNVMQTDVRESRDLLSLRLFLTVIGIGLLPALAICNMRIQPLRAMSQLIRNVLTAVVFVGILVAVTLLVFQDFSSLMRNDRQVRYMVNPLNTVYSIGRAAAGSRAHPGKVVAPVGEDAKLGTRYDAAHPPVFLFVLGETARADHFSLNGYARPTNPELAAAGVTSFREVRSCGTSTAASVPCMFSHRGREGYLARAHEEETLMDVLQRSGLAVLWLDNQSGCKHQCDRIPDTTTSEMKTPGLCADGECFDEIMLRELDAQIAALEPQRRARGIVVVLHQMGSHGPAYYKRSPSAFKKFMPECTTNVLQQCSNEELINAYDNTIAYTDHFLAQAIAWLRKRDAQNPGALLYVSDHGESLGENNIYLHGLPYAIAPDTQKHVPMVVWLSPSMQSRASISTACLNGRKDAALSHDNLYHSVLGLMDVHTSIYKPEMDLFAPCTGR